MCSKCEAMSSRRPAPAFGVATIASACGAAVPSSSCISRDASVSSRRLVPSAQPPAGREGHDRSRPAARGELQRDVAAERVADDVGGLEAGVVHRALDRVGIAPRSISPSSGGPPACPGSVGASTRVALERGQHELPGSPRVREAVQADERRPGAAAVRWGERGVQAADASAGLRGWGSCATLNHMVQHRQIDRTFAALADPTRRGSSSDSGAAARRSPARGAVRDLAHRAEEARAGARGRRARHHREGGAGAPVQPRPAASGGRRRSGSRPTAGCWRSASTGSGSCSNERKGEPHDQ